MPVTQSILASSSSSSSSSSSTTGCTTCTYYAWSNIMSAFSVLEICWQIPADAMILMEFNQQYFHKECENVLHCSFCCVTSRSHSANLVTWAWMLFHFNDSQMTQWAIALTATVLTNKSWNNRVSAPEGLNYRKVSNIRRTKCQNLNDSRLVLQLSVPNPLKPSVKSIMKM